MKSFLPTAHMNGGGGESRQPRCRAPGHQTGKAVPKRPETAAPHLVSAGQSQGPEQSLTSTGLLAAGPATTAALGPPSIPALAAVGVPSRGPRRLAVCAVCAVSRQLILKLRGWSSANPGPGTNGWPGLTSLAPLAGHLVGGGTRLLPSSPTMKDKRTWRGWGWLWGWHLGL